MTLCTVDTPSDPLSARAEFPVVASAHLRLRAFTATDLAALLWLAHEPRAAESTGHWALPAPSSKLRSWIEAHALEWRTRQAVHWAVMRLGDGQLIGHVGLQDLQLGQRQAELALWMAPGRDRMRFAIEATQAAVAYAFTDLQLERVYAFHLRSNLWTEAVLSAVGLRQEAVLDQNADRAGSLIVRGIARPDWIEALHPAVHH